MTDYGKGSVLGAAVTLPATSGVIMYYAGSMNPWITAGFIFINLVAFVILVGFVSRYLTNR